eukprot:1159653-Pelagomonas_calceolata.AAC.5
MPSSRAGGALGGPCWPSSAQLPDKEVSEHFAHCLPQLTDTAMLPGIRLPDCPLDQFLKLCLQPSIFANFTAVIRLAVHLVKVASVREYHYSGTLRSAMAVEPSSRVMSLIQSTTNSSNLEELWQGAHDPLQLRSQHMYSQASSNA